MAVKLKQRFSAKTVHQAFNRPWWTIETVSPISHILRFDQVGAGWKRWLMLTSDRHWDNPKSKHELQIKHLEMAHERDAVIVDAGDFFCAMQGRGDPRSGYDSLRPEHKRDDYLDALVDTAVDFFKPYAKHFAVIGHGNHENNIVKRFGIDLINGLTKGLRGAGGATVSGGYEGWVTMRFSIQQTVSLRRVLHYYHGSGVGGPVTRGVIGTNRMGVIVPDANLILSGHTHDMWAMPIPRYRISLNGVPFKDIAWHVKAPTYKDEFEIGNGWAVEKGLNPKPLGCWFVEMTYDQGQINLMPMPEVVAQSGLAPSEMAMDYVESAQDYYPVEDGEGDG